jgi:NADH dehydrogenase
MKKNLVIVGGGFAGVYTYQSLPAIVKKHYSITVIDQHNYFLFTPLLHEVATGSLDTNHVVEPLEKILGPEVRFVQDTVIAFDHENNIITLQDSEPINYDIAVIALGSQTNFFETPGAQEKSFVLKTLSDAQRIKDHFIENFKTASMMSSKEDRIAQLSTVIIGGGPTGVELAGETAELFYDTFARYYEGSFDANEAQIYLVNRGDALLKSYAPSSQYYAQKVLREKGVKVINNTGVVEVSDAGAHTKDGDIIAASTIIWAAGVKPQVVDSVTPKDHDRHRLKVSETLQMKNHPNVFVLGDMALAPTGDERGYPMLAQVAKQQGIQTAQNIGRMIQGEELKAFSYTERGKLASLGKWHAIAEVGKVKIHGPLSWFLWRSIYLVNFASWNKRFKIALDWTLNFFSKRDITKL